MKRKDTTLFMLIFLKLVHLYEKILNLFILGIHEKSDLLRYSEKLLYI